MSALVAGIATLLVALTAYAVLSAVLLSYLRLPDDPLYAALEDLVFVVTAPFVVVVLGSALLRKERVR